MIDLSSTKEEDSIEENQLSAEPLDKTLNVETSSGAVVSHILAGTTQDLVAGPISPCSEGNVLEIYWMRRPSATVAVRSGRKYTTSGRSIFIDVHQHIAFGLHLICQQFFNLILM